MITDCYWPMKERLRHRIVYAAPMRGKVYYQWTHTPAGRTITALRRIGQERLESPRASAARSFAEEFTNAPREREESGT